LGRRLRTGPPSNNLGARSVQYCHSCDAQFPDLFRKCQHCGRRLLDKPRHESLQNAPKSALEGLCLIARRHPSRTLTLLQALQRAGIEFVPVADGGSHRVNWHHGSSGHQAFVDIYVQPKDVERACQIEQRLLQETLPDLPSELGRFALDAGNCPACGFRLAPRASACPDCGLSLLS
jgi:DNA-directed RNA polymerase subunit RPC12/RpoP